MTKRDSTYRTLDVSTPAYPDTHAILDLDDYEWASQWKWHMDGNGYVRRSVPRSKVRRKIYLARALLQPEDDCVVDHINGDPLDNRRCNLRLLSRRDNAINCRANPGREFKGVSKHRKSGYEAFVGVYGKRRYLGLYREIEHGALAYDVAATMLFGKRVAVTNFDNPPTLADLVRLWVDTHGIPDQADMLGKRADPFDEAA